MIHKSFYFLTLVSNARSVCALMSIWFDFFLQLKQYNVSHPVAHRDTVKLIRLE
jgi:hypothetical protein